MEKYDAVLGIHGTEELTAIVLESRSLGPETCRMPKDEINSTVDSLANAPELTDDIDRRSANHSGGQKQCVAMGRATVGHPEVFLFDEPWSNPDTKQRTHMRAERKRLHMRLEVSSINVSHNRGEGMTPTDWFRCDQGYTP